ncbi:hypothetical protein, partial [Escherichia coli]|uniref:hypothetical protein n=2 Tax=Escherichia coli TaxID=562 RepID=UPI002FD708F1
MISIPHIGIYVFESINIISAIGRLEIRVRPAIFGTVNSSKVTFFPLNLQSKCNKKRSTHQLEYNFVSTQKPFPNDEYFLPTSYNKRA